jgi:lipoate-protein ligase A
MFPPFPAILFSMKLIIILLVLSFSAHAQNLTADEQRALLKEVQSLKERVNQLEKKNSGQGFRSTDYNSKTTESTSAKSGSQEPTMTPEQRKEIMETMEKYKKAQAEQEKALKELEDEE